MQVKFNESTIYSGKNYVRGEIYTLDAKDVRALGSSVEILDHHEDLQNIQDTQNENKQVDAPSVDKMMDKPKKKK